MSGVVWTKFFWSDWETDPALRFCSLAAQGLWMRMLCIAAAHEPIGYVAVAGRPLGTDEIARMVGGSVEEVGDLVVELERNGVFSRDRLKRIYSRRMVKDAKKTSVAIMNGKKGGNPTLSKQKDSANSDNPHKPESRVQSPEQEESRAEALDLLGAPAQSPKRTKGTEPDGFAEFYASYPRKVGRPKAAEAFGRAVRGGAVPAELLAAVRAFASACAGKEMDYIPHPTTWLNQKRWQDEPSRGSAEIVEIRPASDRDWLARLRLWQYGDPHDEPAIPPRFWTEAWGPKPGEPGFRCPQRAINEFKAEHYRRFPKAKVQ